MVAVRNASLADYIRFLFSFLLLLFSLVVTCYAIVEQKTLFWKAVPGVVALGIFAVVLVMLGIVEGLQIALVELKRQHPDTYRVSHPRAYWLGQLAAKSDNVERFLMGRQVFVVLLVYFSAKLTTIHLAEDESFLFPTPLWFQSAFLETGILACIVVVILAQLMPQIVAAQYPVHFLEYLVMRPAYYVCVFVETTGLTHACWVLAYLMCWVSGMRGADDTCESMAKVNAQLDALTKDIDKQNDQNGEVVIKVNLDDDLVQNGSPQATGDRYQALYKGLECNIDADTMEVIRRYLDNHPEGFNSFPSVVGGRVYPSPQAIAQHMTSSGSSVPSFLTAINDPDHVPPHIVACRLLVENQALQTEISKLREHGTRAAE